MNIFKVHTKEEYGKPEMIDGWVTAFFPFLKTGQRVDKTYFETTPFSRVVKDINPQVVNLDFIYQLKDARGNILQQKPMLLVAGFMGIEQDEKTLALKPHLGWCIGEDQQTLQEIKTHTKGDILIYHNLESVPEEVLSLNNLDQLNLNFIDNNNHSGSVTKNGFIYTNPIRKFKL